jgi:DeoR/GlpR family transcriptional regulator of sugar metabolism
MKQWTFITSHGAVLAFIAKHKHVRAIDIATAIGLTERSIRRIIADLEHEGYISKKREGWVNLYEINQKLPLRRRASQDITTGELLKLLLSSKKTKAKPGL